MLRYGAGTRAGGQPPISPNLAAVQVGGYRNRHAMLEEVSTEDEVVLQCAGAELRLGEVLRVASPWSHRTHSVGVTGIQVQVPN